MNNNFKFLLHPDFKINGQSFILETLYKHANLLQKSKEIYLVEIGNFLQHWLSDESFITVLTSGSTGNPKPIQLQKAHMRNSAIATGKYFNLPKGTKALLCLSANYIAGKMMLVRAMSLGWDIHITPTTSSPLKHSNVLYDFCAMVPMQVESSLQKLNQIDKLIIGGAPVSNLLQSKIKQLATKCYATYGMTETITHVAVKTLNHKEAQNTYCALPEVKFSLDARGCLVIEANKVTSELIVTNDIVNLLSENEFEWLGRYDNVINSGGVKLFPEKIEQKLSNVIRERFFVAGIPDDRLGEQLILIVESKKEYLECLKYVRKVGLSKFEIPKKYYLLSKFKETPTGKINRIETLKLIT